MDLIKRYHFDFSRASYAERFGSTMGQIDWPKRSYSSV
jgi:hypothetical protein